jgi:Mg2+-importing ATPase
MGFPKATLNPSQRLGNLTRANGAHSSDQLLEKARADTDTVLKELESQLDGLSQEEADSRRKQYGLNEIAREKHQSALMRLLNNVKNPLVILLTALGVLSFLAGDLRATVVIFVMVVLGVLLRFFQEMRADKGAMGRQVVNWQHTLEQKWATLRFGEVKVVSDKEDHVFEVLVYLNGLAPNTVR